MSKINIGVKVGDRFSKLLVIGQGKRCDSFICRCDCGVERTFGQSVLKSKHNTNCGSPKCNTTITHGLTRTNFYRKWDSIQRRCYRKSYKNFNRYGGRGIKCEWNKFENFKNDMYQSYLEHIKLNGIVNTTIERIDVNGNYCKENCRWATQKEQGNNRSSNKFINYKGNKITLTQLAEQLGVYRIKIHNLLRTRGEQDVLRMIENGDIYKTSKGKKLELV